MSPRSSCPSDPLVLDMGVAGPSASKTTFRRHLSLAGGSEASAQTDA